jgi:hypothetical protein
MIRVLFAWDEWNVDHISRHRVARQEAEEVGMKRESFEELERQALNVGDLQPMSPSQRRQWEIAQRTGGKQTGVRRGRPRKDPALKSRIVPISIDPALLDRADQYANAAGISRSCLIAEALEQRLAS